VDADRARARDPPLGHRLCTDGQLNGLARDLIATPRLLGCLRRRSGDGVTPST
jgi:hypothetical protein